MTGLPGMGTDVLILALRIAMVVALYAFLLALLAAARGDLGALAAQRPSASDAPASTARLIVLAAGTSSLRPGTAIAVGATVAIGRAPDNELVVDDEFVSAHHARLVLHAGSWWLSDLGSTNGTALNEHPLRRDTQVRFGDVIGVGGARFKLAPPGERA